MAALNTDSTFNKELDKLKKRKNRPKPNGYYRTDIAQPLPHDTDSVSGSSTIFTSKSGLAGSVGEELTVDTPIDDSFTNELSEIFDTALSKIAKVVRTSGNPRIGIRYFKKLKSLKEEFQDESHRG